MQPLSFGAVSGLLQALRLDPAQAPEAVAALAKWAGQDLNLLVLLKTPEGVLLRMPTGQRFQALGELPFPEGTQLQVNVHVTPEGIRLRTLAAQPPETPPLLSPLLHGEARSLMEKVASGEGGDWIALLRSIVKALEPPIEATRMPVVSGGVSEPDLMDVAQALSTLPSADRATLARALGMTPEAAPVKLAEAFIRVLMKPAMGDEGAFMAGPRVLTRLARLLGRPFGSIAAQEPLAQLVLKFFGGAEASPVKASELPTDEGPVVAPEVARLAHLVGSKGTPAAEWPEAWEAWLPTTLKALSDPATSPREARFHALQAQEGTAFFEVPLPWGGREVLHLWVEEAPEREERNPDEPLKRVLLGLRLSALGEVRAGFAWAPRALSVRLWVEHPEPLAEALDELQRELATEGRAVDLKLLPLHRGPEGIPSLKALVTGRHLEALG